MIELLVGARRSSIRRIGQGRRTLDVSLHCVRRGAFFILGRGRGHGDGRGDRRRNGTMVTVRSSPYPTSVRWLELGP